MSQISVKDILTTKFPAVLYAAKYHKNTKGEALDFQQFPHLKQILSDPAETIVGMKCVQIGFTEILIAISFATAGAMGFIVYYVVPNDHLLAKTSKIRLDPLIRDVPFYGQLVSQARIQSDNSYIKGIGNGAIILVGSEAKANTQSFPADLLIVDEYDFCNQDNLPKMEDRLAASKYQRRIFVSNPTVEGYGISKLFEESDQKEWVIVCQDCGELQPLDWFKNVVDPSTKGLLDKEWTAELPRDIHLYCRSCKKILNRFTKGAWIPKKKSRISGYHANRLISRTCRISALYGKYMSGVQNPLAMSAFMNSDLGVPSSGAAYQVTPEMILDAVGDYPTQMGCRDQTVIGCDVGGSPDKPSHYYWIMGLHSGKVFKVGVISDISDLLPMIEPMNTVGIVLDAEPEISMAKNFQDEAQSRFPFCTILRADTLASSGSRGITRDFEHGMIRFTKTEMYDELFSRLASGRLQFPEDILFHSPDFIRHMQSIKRVPDIVKDKVCYIWKKVGEDHYYSAGVFAVAAQMICGGSSTQIVEPLIKHESSSREKVATGLGSVWNQEGGPAWTSVNLEEAPWRSLI